MTVELILEALR